MRITFCGLFMSPFQFHCSVGIHAFVFFFSLLPWFIICFLIKTSRDNIQYFLVSIKTFNLTVSLFVSKTIWLYVDYNDFWVIAISTKQNNQIRGTHEYVAIHSRRKRKRDREKQNCVQKHWNLIRCHRYFQDFFSIYFFFSLFHLQVFQWLSVCTTATISFFAHSLCSITVPMRAIMLMMCVYATLASALLMKWTTNPVPL